MILKEKERSVIEDLQTQEKSCVEKYGKYAEQARDPELKNLFRNIQQEEQKHYESLSMICRKRNYIKSESADTIRLRLHSVQSAVRQLQ